MKTKWTHVLLTEATRDRIDAEVRRRRQADGGRHSRASVVAEWAERCEGEARSVAPGPLPSAEAEARMDYESRAAERAMMAEDRR